MSKVIVRTWILRLNEVLQDSLVYYVMYKNVDNILQRRFRQVQYVTTCN